MKIKSTLLALSLSFSVFANPQNVVFDKDSVNLLYAVKECSEYFNQVLNSSDSIRQVSVEYTQVTPNAPADEFYLLTTARGDFAGPTLTMNRHYKLDASDQWHSYSECNIAY